MFVARAHSWSPVAHLVDDGGALCGARPGPDWLLSQVMPANCPRCLIAQSRPRYALCEALLPGDTYRLHIRRVGTDGLTMRGIGYYNGKADLPPLRLTLCKATVQWDVTTVRPLKRGESLCEPCRRAFRDVIT